MTEEQKCYTCRHYREGTGYPGEKGKGICDTDGDGYYSGFRVDADNNVCFYEGNMYNMISSEQIKKVKNPLDNLFENK